MSEYWAEIALTIVAGIGAIWGVAKVLIPKVNDSILRGIEGRRENEGDIIQQSINRVDKITDWLMGEVSKEVAETSDDIEEIGGHLKAILTRFEVFARQNHSLQEDAWRLREDIPSALEDVIDKRFASLQERIDMRFDAINRQIDLMVYFKELQLGQDETVDGRNDDNNIAGSASVRTSQDGELAKAGRNEGAISHREQSD